MIQARELGIPFSVPFIVPELSIDDVQAAGAAGEGLISSASWLITDQNLINQDLRAKITRRHTASNQTRGRRIPMRRFTFWLRR